MLFLLIMEVLSAVIRKADAWGLVIQLGVRSIPHRTSMYVDDLILFVKPLARDRQLLHSIFDSFQGVLGLGYNLSKCQMVLIRCDQTFVDPMMELFSFQVVNFLICYLGVPLSVTKLPRSAWQPLLDRAADQLLTWKGSLMNRSGRLALIKSTLSAIPIYVCIRMGLPAWVHNALLKLMKAFLWSGSGKVQGGKCMVAWHVVHRPRQLGGLGILDLKLFGQALRLRWMWLQKMDLTVPGRPCLCGRQ
jgi:hypothetical protein